MNRNITDVLGDLNAGVTADILTNTLREAASRALEQERGAEVALTLKLKPVKGAHNQLSIETIIKNKMPTVKGDKAETVIDETVMYVSAKGDLTIIPDTAVELPGMAVNQ